MSKATGEAEHLKDMLVGNILSVQWPEVVADRRASTLAIGVFHFVFRKRFLEISDGPRKAAAARGISVRFWDFLFYASFGFVVTRSVAIAGVLLVFCYLIVPSVARDALRENIGSAPGDRLDDGHPSLSALGVCVSSLQLDLPTGATIVCTFGLALILMAAAAAADSCRGRMGRCAPDL